MNTNELKERIKELSRGKVLKDVKVVIDNSTYKNAYAFSHVPLRIVATEGVHILSVKELYQEIIESNRKNMHADLSDIQLTYTPPSNMQSSEPRNLFLFSVFKENGHLVFNTKYLDLGDYILLKYTESTKSYLVMAKVLDIENKFQANEIVELEYVMEVNQDFELIEQKAEHCRLSFNETRYEIFSHLSAEIFKTLKKEAMTYQILKEQMPFANQSFLQNLNKQLLAIK